MANFANPQEDTNVLRMVLASGTAALPSVVFSNDLTKGLSWTVDGLRLSGLAAPINDDDAANKAYVDGSSPSPSFPLLAPDGTTNAPSYGFTDSTAGFFYDGTNSTVGVSAAASLAVEFGELILGKTDGSTGCNIMADDHSISMAPQTGSIAYFATLDDAGSAGETTLLLWDVTAATLQRVSIGAADSGGTGFRVLRIPN